MQQRFKAWNENFYILSFLEVHLLCLKFLSTNVDESTAKKKVVNCLDSTASKSDNWRNLKFVGKLERKTQ